jgi:hypothetical protein
MASSMHGRAVAQQNYATRRWLAFDDADAELRRLIREGFEQGISGEKLSAAAGLTGQGCTRLKTGDGRSPRAHILPTLDHRIP